MRIFCYGRKSVYSDTSDSVDNQTRMCREYCDTRLQVDSWTVFTDEDFSGSNTSRPGLQRMLRLIKTGQADALIVYQLDRLSRSVRDFSAIYAELEEHGVQFISLKEQIDTTTPIGRAMMYVTVVFAQMARETIAQRVRDNLLGLAKKGWWVGGRAPVGFRSRRVTDAAGRRHVVLEPDPDAAAYVRGLYDAYRDAGYALSQVEQQFKRARIRTKTGTFFSSTQIYQILHNPVYATADQETYDHFAALGCQMVDDRSSWDGTRGVLSYGRTTERSGTHELTEPSEWLIRTGHHAPIIPGGLWLDAQRHFGRAKFEKETRYPVALLKGVAHDSVRHAQHKVEGELGTGVVGGDKLVGEVVVTRGNKGVLVVACQAMASKADLALCGVCAVVAQVANDGEEHGRAPRPKRLVALPEVLVAVELDAHELGACRVDCRRDPSAANA